MNIDEILKESSDSIEIDDLESVKMYENIKSKCLKQKTQRKDKTHLYTLLAIISDALTSLLLGAEESQNSTVIDLTSLNIGG